MFYKYFLVSGKLHIVECESQIKTLSTGEREIHGILVRDTKDIIINKTFRSSTTWKNLFPTAIGVPAKHVFLEERNDQEGKRLLNEYYSQKALKNNSSIEKLNKKEDSLNAILANLS